MVGVGVQCISMDERDILESHRLGEPAAFERLFDLYADRVYSFVFHLLKDVSRAEDVTQEVFIKIWKGLSRFDASKPLKPWIFTIARNAAFDAARKRRDFSFTDLEGDGDDASFADSIVDEKPLADERFEAGELRTVLDDVMASISVQDRSIVLLHDVEGMTFDEIAEILGRPTNTVKSRYRRAVMSLRLELGKRGVKSGAPKLQA